MKVNEMVLEQEFQKLLIQLIYQGIASIKVGGSPVALKLYEGAERLTLSATVYRGEHFVPKSVRKCITQEPPFARSSIKTFLTLSEEKNQIDLHYLGTLDGLDKKKFKALIDEFAWIADEWRFLLDEHDRRDLLYVRHG